MFMQRLIMTLILIPLVLTGIYALPTTYFSGIVLLLVGLMIWEWQQFVAMPEIKNPYLKFLILFIGTLLVLMFWPYFLYIDILFWLFAVFAVLSFPKHQALWGNSGFIAMTAWILLGVFAAILINLQSDAYGKNELVAILMIVWAADIGAYLVGKRWGQHKMIPNVSPGKSWEGLFGGIGLALLVGGLETILMHPLSIFQWLGIVFITALISVIGDLWMSLLKRKCQLKDTGHLIPGHGGILDRLDSLLAAMPVFYLCSHILLNRC